MAHTYVNDHERVDVHMAQHRRIAWPPWCLVIGFPQLGSRKELGLHQLEAFY